MFFKFQGSFSISVSFPLYFYKHATSSVLRIIKIEVLLIKYYLKECLVSVYKLISFHKRSMALEEQQGLEICCFRPVCDLQEDLNSFESQLIHKNGITEQTQD